MEWVWRDVPDEVRRVAEPILRESEHLVPGWCTRIIVEWDGGRDDEAAAMITPRDHYRLAFLNLKAHFLSAAPALRREYLEHELLHLATARIKDVVCDMMDHFVPENARAFVSQQWVAAWEMATQDTLHAIWRDREQRSIVPHGRDA